MDNGRREPSRMRYSVESRLRIVRMIERGATPSEAALACGASRSTGYRLWRSYRQHGWQGLVDRPSTPIRQPRRLSETEEAQIIAVRLELRTGPQMLSRVLNRPASTIGKVLRRAGCSRLPGPIGSCGNATSVSGQVSSCTSTSRSHKDGRRLSSGAGWSYLHIAIDDHTRLAYAELLQDERGPSCAAFLRRATGWYAERGITIERVLTDNAKAYHGRFWIAACGELTIGRRYTKPYSPWTNGKAGAFIKAMLHEWAYRHS